VSLSEGLNVIVPAPPPLVTDPLSLPGPSSQPTGRLYKDAGRST